MAGDWIKMELTLPDKPEVHYIANGLKIDPDAVIGKLLRVWAWFDMHTENGNALGVTFSLVDRLTGVTGFGESMQFAGWLEQRDKMLCMVNFDRHTSESAKKRALTAKRQHKFRNAEVTQKVTQPALPREEKRREDIKQKQSAPATPLPDFVPLDAWTAYVETRKAIKKPITPRASELAVTALQKLKSEGHDPRAVLEQSVLNSWQGLFPVKVISFDGKPVAISPADKKCTCGRSLRFGSTDGMCDPCWRLKTYGAAEARA